MEFLITSRATEQCFYKCVPVKHGCEQSAMLIMKKQNKMALQMFYKKEMCSACLSGLEVTQNAFC